jgi:hypothetical protein
MLPSTRTVWKFRGFTLLIRVGTSWRCGDGLFFSIPPVTSDVLLTSSTHFSKTCCRLLITSKFLASDLSLVGKAQKSHGARSGLYVGCSNGVPSIQFFQAEQGIHFGSRPVRFLGFSNHEKGAPRQEISKLPTVCSTFSRSGWSVVRSTSLAKGGTSEKRPSQHLHKVPTRSNKVSPRTLLTALVALFSSLGSSVKYHASTRHTSTQSCI